MDESTGTFSLVRLSNSHPLDLMYDINPELSSLIYADNSGVIRPGLRPLIARFRELQSGEKIEAMRGIVEKYGWDSRVEIERNAQDGMNFRCATREDGLTTRTQIEADTRLEVQKLKYNLGRAISQDHLEGQKYLSDNQLRATVIESQAAVESIRIAETLRADTAKALSRDRLLGIIRESEIKYASLLKQAETERAIAAGRDRKDITLAYITEQARINRSLIEAQLSRDSMLAKLAEHYYDTMGKVGEAGVEAMLKSGTRKFTFRGSGSFGDLNVDMELE